MKIAKKTTSPPRQRRFDVAEYYCLHQIGMIAEKNNELINGKIYTMSPTGVRHAWVINLLNRLFTKRLTEDYIVSVQNPIRLDDYSEPEPDLAILHTPPTPYADSHPGADQVALLIEVADSSLLYDRETKAPLYARFGIPKYWILNLQDNQLEVYSQPEKTAYTQQQTLAATEKVTAFGREWSVGELLGEV